MKSPIFMPCIVLIGLLLAAALCLTSHKAKVFTDLDTPNLYLPVIEKLEQSPSFEGKETVVTVLRTLVTSQSSGLKALHATAELKETLGYFLLVLAFIQGAGVFILFRNMHRKAQ